jgi:hypothetical protein
MAGAALRLMPFPDNNRRLFQTARPRCPTHCADRLRELALQEDKLSKVSKLTNQVLVKP